MPVLRRIRPKTIEIYSLDEYIRIVNEEKNKEESVEKNSDFIFRGQDCDQPLKPRICRLIPRGSLKNVEKIILEEFKRCAIPFLNPIPNNDWEWIALAQHYGMPTRYLDWTYSALSALWFATKNDSNIKKEYTENYSLNDQFGVVYLFKPNVDDFYKAEIYDSPLNIKMSVIYRPPMIDKRLVQQQGIFTAHLLNNIGIVINFEQHGKYINKLLKIKFSKELFPRLRKELNMLGYNYSTQFPDLMGLCDNLRWRYFCYEDEKKIYKIRRITKTLQ